LLNNQIINAKPSPGPRHSSEVHNFEFQMEKKTGTFFIRGEYAYSLFQQMTEVEAQYFSGDENNHSEEKVGTHLRCMKLEDHQYFTISHLCNFKLKDINQGLLDQAPYTDPMNFKTNYSGRIEIDLNGKIQLTSHVASLIFDNLAKSTITEVKNFGGYDPTDPLQDNGPVILERITKSGKDIICIKIHRPAKPSVFTESIECSLKFKNLKLGKF